MRAGIFGPSMSGKTTLAKALSSQYWNTQKIKSLVLDPNSDQWGAHAIVTNDEKKFWDLVWASRKCLVIVEESSETINRDKELTPVFTRMRHSEHKLIVIGHSGASLLPVMRQQFDTLYLFLQGRKAAVTWSEECMSEHLMSCTSLQQYEFLFWERFRAPRKMILNLGGTSGAKEIKG